MLSDAEKLVAVLESVYENASEIRDRIESASIELKDIADTVRQELSEMDGDIGELEMIDERLSLIYTLQQKFKVHSVEDLLALKQDMEQRVSAIDHSEEKVGRYDAPNRGIGEECECVGRFIVSGKEIDSRFFHGKFEGESTRFRFEKFLMGQ